jgi:hypothetical protein
MTELLKKGIKFSWDQKCDDAFHTLRDPLTTTPVLAQPDVSKPLKSIVMHQEPDLVVYLYRTTE